MPDSITTEESQAVDGAFETLLGSTYVQEHIIQLLMH
jgi:hypothetical protein